MAALFNYAVTIKDDQTTYDFLYRFVGGLIYAVANTPALSLNFYPIMGELGGLSDHLHKKCNWSEALFKILKQNSTVMSSRLNVPEEIQDWYRTIGDDEMLRNLRLFVHQFVPMPNNLWSSNELIDER